MTINTEFRPTATTALLVRAEDRMLGKMGDLQRAYGYEAFCDALSMMSAVCEQEAADQQANAYTREYDRQEATAPAQIELY